MKKTEWTVDSTETLRRLVSLTRREDGRINWKELFTTPAGRQLLKGRKPKDVMNRYTWYIARKTAPAEQSPAPVPLAATANGRWTPEEEAELARLVGKYTYGKGVGWKRMQQEEPEALARLTANRPLSAVQQKYKKGSGGQRKTYKRRAVESEQEAEAQVVERPLPHFCYNCGANLTPVNKGLELYHKLKHR